MSVSEPKVSNQKHKTRQKAAAWAVHSFTTSGIVLGFLGLVAVFEGKQELAFIFMGLALLVDGVDGTLARLAKVTQVTPLPWFFPFARSTWPAKHFATKCCFARRASRFCN